MLLYEIMLGFCLALLFSVQIWLVRAYQAQDRRPIRVLQLLKIGLGFSALSYLFRIADPSHTGPAGLLSFVFCLFGTVVLWLGWREHWALRSERPNAPTVLRGEEDESAAEAAPSALGPLPRLTARAQQALLHAQDEACRRHDGCVDTDHLLLGLLRDSGSAGVHILHVLGASPVKVHLELLAQMAPQRSLTKPPRQRPNPVALTKTGPSALTERAGQVVALAAQEAHRFDKASVGTEHLLLALVLVGKGRAAAALFGAGITADAIRNEIVKAKKAA